ncbi:MAG: MFS transporter [Caldilineales bacterium]|nr:MFS transporter [Caldilineales bacterium]
MLILLRNRTYRLLWLANALAVLGEVLFNVGVMFVIYERTGSAFQTIGVMVGTLLPPFLLGPVAGALVDRYPRRWVLAGTNAARAGLVAALFWLAPASNYSVWVIYAAAAGLAAAKAFFDPARQAALPAAVARRDLVLANSLMMTTTQAAYALGYAFGGVLALRAGFAGVVWITVAAFILAGGLAVALILPALPAQTEARLGMWQQARAGMAYIRRHTLARPLILMEMLEYIPHGIWTAALMLAFTERALGGDVVWWGWQNASYYAGMLIGAVLGAALAGRLSQQPGWAVIGGAASFSLLTLGYALSPTLLFAVLIGFFFGPISAVRDLAQEALLQATVAPAYLGRVFALRTMGLSLTFMLAAPLFAWGADHAPVRAIYLLGSGLYALTALFAFSRPAIRRSRISAA